MGYVIAFILGEFAATGILLFFIGAHSNERIDNDAENEN